MQHQANLGQLPNWVSVWWCVHFDKQQNLCLKLDDSSTSMMWSCCLISASNYGDYAAGWAMLFPDAKMGCHKTQVSSWPSVVKHPHGIWTDCIVNWSRSFSSDPSTGQFLPGWVMSFLVKNIEEIHNGWYLMGKNWHCFCLLKSLQWFNSSWLDIIFLVSPQWDLRWTEGFIMHSWVAREMGPLFHDANIWHQAKKS